MNDTIILKKGTIETGHYYSKDELLQVLPISEDVLNFWISDGLPFLPVGTGALVEGADIIHYFEENKVTRKKLEETNN